MKKLTHKSSAPPLKSPQIAFRKTSLLKRTLLLITTSLVSLTNSQTISFNTLTKTSFGGDYPAFLSNPFPEDLYPVPANTKKINIRLQFYVYIILQPVAGGPIYYDYTPPSKTVWMEFKPQTQLELNQVAKAEGDAATTQPFLKITPSYIKHPVVPGIELSDFKFEVYDSTFNLIGSKSIGEVNNFSGVFGQDWYAMDTSRIRFDIEIELEPLRVKIQPWFYNDYWTYYKPVIITTGSNYDFGFDSLAQIRTLYNQNLNNPFQDGEAPVGPTIAMYKSLVVTGGSLSSATFNDRYFQLVLNQAGEEIFTWPQVEWKQVVEFDLRPDSTFTTNFFDESNGFNLGISQDTVDDKKLYCQSGVQNSCRYVRNIADGSYSLYTSQSSGGMKIRFKGDEFTEPDANGINNVGFSKNEFVGQPHVRTNIMYFQLLKEPGMHSCDINSLISVQITVGFSNDGTIYIGDKKTDLKIETKKWYALATTWIGDLRASARSDTTAPQSMLVMLTDLSNNQTKEANFEGTVAFSRLDSAIYGGKTCGAEMLIKYVIWTPLALAPYDSANGCVENIPYQVYQRFDANLAKTCLENKLVDKSGLSDKVFDQDVSLTRTDPSQCTRSFWDVKGVSQCECQGGSSLQDGKCKCPNSEDYYDYVRGFCSSCPLGYKTNERGDNCEVFNKTTKSFEYYFNDVDKEINIFFSEGFPEEYKNGDFKKFITLQIEGYSEGKEYAFSAVLENDGKTIKLLFDPKPLFDYKTITFTLYSKDHKIEPNLAEIITGPDNNQFSAFNSISEKISPEAVQTSENIILFGSIIFPSILEDIPFIFTFFSFLRTLNFYPIKLPENLHKFLKLFYVHYSDTYGHKILVEKMKTGDNPPLLKIEQRTGIYISKIMYFSNTIPVVSFVSKVALIWYLVKWFKKSKKATLKDVRKEIIKVKNEGCIETILTYLFRKFMTFLIIKIHVYLYGRLIFIFAAFQGSKEVMEYNTAIGLINIFESLFDFTIVVWIELKIFDFLRTKRTRVQLMMLDISDLKSILMINVFHMKKDQTHSATYLCIVNICLFFLSVSLVVFQKFVEMMFFIHILIFLGLTSYTILSKKKFKKSVYFYVYLANNFGFAIITIFYSFFMYYTEFSPKTNARNGLVISICILVLMLSKLIFFGVKTVIDFCDYRKRKKTLKKVQQKNGKFFIKKSKNKMIKGSENTLGNTNSTKKKLEEEGDKTKNNTGQKSSLLKFVMNRNNPSSPKKSRGSFFRRSSIRSNARNTKKKLMSGIQINESKNNEFDTIKSSKFNTSERDSGSDGFSSKKRPSNIDVDFKHDDDFSDLESPRKSRFSKKKPIYFDDMEQEYSHSNRSIDVRKKDRRGSRRSVFLKDKPKRSNNEKKSRFRNM